MAKQIKERVDTFLEDRRKPNPKFKREEIPGELHGFLIDFVFIDKVEDELFVVFLISLLNTQKKAEEVLRLLEDTSTSLGKIIAKSPSL